MALALEEEERARADQIGTFDVSIVSRNEPKVNGGFDLTQQVLDALIDAAMARNGRRVGDEIRCTCPNAAAHKHGDARASGRVHAVKGAWYCDVCGEGGGALDFLRRLGIEGRQHEGPHRQSTATNGAGPGKLEATYSYHDEHGILSFEVQRFRQPDGTKTFRQRRPDGHGGWINKLGDAVRVLYRLQKLLAADPALWIFVCEGEKDADRLTRLGLIATTNAGGAGKFRPEYSEPLRGRKVAIFADNDAAGRRHATTVAGMLDGKAAVVKVIELPGLPEKGDVSDWLDAGGTVDELKRMVEETQVWAPGGEPPEAAADGPPESPAIIRAMELLAKRFPEPRWAVPQIIPEGVSLIAGAPKLGKSWLALQIAIAVAAGGRALGQIAVQQGDVLYLALEDSQRRLQERLISIMGDEPTPERLSFATGWPSLQEGAVEHLRAWLTEHPGARLVIVDTFGRIRGHVPSNGSIYNLDYAAMSAVKGLADEFGVAILLVHHTRKSPAEDPLDTVNGSQGLAGAADTILVLRREVGRSNATLYLRGRDVPEMDHALGFDAESFMWNLLGPAADFRLSLERQEILDLLNAVDEPMRPKEIAGALKKNSGAIRVLLHKMVRDGQLEGLGGGLYQRKALPASESGNASGNAFEGQAERVTTSSAQSGNTGNISRLPLGEAQKSVTGTQAEAVTLGDNGNVFGPESENVTALSPLPGGNSNAPEPLPFHRNGREPRWTGEL